MPDDFRLAGNGDEWLEDGGAHSIAGLFMEVTGMRQQMPLTREKK